MVCVLLFVAAAARADDPERIAVARQHFQMGRELYLKGRFDDAASEFEVGYRFQPQPLFLYNIAQSARRAGRVDKAIDQYRRYLAADPNAPERAEVERYLAELEHLRAASTPPPTAPAPAPAPHARSRRGLWIGLGVGAAAVVVAGVATGLALGLTRGAPSTDLGNHVFVGR
jgi:tetratricopeptide (TPR) repeat protein